MSAQIEAMCRLLEGSGDMTPMATRQILAVMATPADRPTTDHGAAGFCTDHGQAADRPSTDALLGALPGLRYENDGHDRPTTTPEALDALRERVAAEIIDVRRTHSRIKGGSDSLLRRHVMGALHDAAGRVLTNAHAEDEYPADWLAALGMTVTDTPTEGGAR